MTARELVVDVPRDLWLTSNQRLHHQARAKTTRALRDLAHTEARRQHLVRDLDRVRIVAHLTYPDRRRRDANNAAPTTKALVDGLVDYGLVPDDNDHHLIGPDHRFAGITPGRYTVRLVVEDLTVDTPPASLRSALRVRTVDAHAQQEGGHS